MLRACRRGLVSSTVARVAGRCTRRDPRHDVACSGLRWWCGCPSGAGGRCSSAPARARRGGMRRAIVRGRARARIAPLGAPSLFAIARARVLDPVALVVWRPTRWSTAAVFLARDVLRAHDKPTSRDRCTRSEARLRVRRRVHELGVRVRWAILLTTDRMAIAAFITTHHRGGLLGRGGRRPAPASSRRRDR